MNIPEFIDSRFRFTIMVARRAKQLINGAPKLVEKKAENPITIAIEEVSSGKVTFETINGVGVNFNESDNIEEESEATENIEDESSEIEEENKELIQDEADQEEDQTETE